MERPGSPGSSERKNRAYLLLSLILLVWNTFASARLALRGVPHGLSGAAAPSIPSDLPPGQGAEPSAPASALRGPLSIRQKYLIGKRLDINRATTEEISELPGISDKVAAAVVAQRHRLGGFRAPRDLLSVPGIKEKRLEKILPFLAQMGNN